MKNSTHCLAESKNVLKLASYFLFVIVITNCFYYSFLLDKEAFIDECLLMLAIKHASCAELLAGKFEYMQTAPIGFAILAKLLFLLHVPERALHILPFVPIVFGVWVLYKICLKFNGAIFGFFFLFVAALNPSLTYFSAILKQYSFEFFITTLLFYQFLKQLEKSDYTIHIWFVVFCFLFSSSSVFVISSYICSLFVVRLKKTRCSLTTAFKCFLTQYLFRLSVVGCCFIVYYFVYLSTYNDDEQHLFWDSMCLLENLKYTLLTNDFMTFMMLLVAPAQFFSTSFELITDLELLTAVLCLVFVFLGYIKIINKNKELKLFIGLTFLFLFFADLFKIYPLPYMTKASGHGIRLAFFLCPFLLFLVSFYLYEAFSQIFKNLNISRFLVSFCIFSSLGFVVFNISLDFVDQTKFTKKFFQEKTKSFVSQYEEQLKNGSVSLYALTIARATLDWYSENSSFKIPYKVIVRHPTDTTFTMNRHTHRLQEFYKFTLVRNNFKDFHDYLKSDLTEYLSTNTLTEHLERIVSQDLNTIVIAVVFSGAPHHHKALTTVEKLCKKYNRKFSEMSFSNVNTVTTYYRIEELNRVL